MWGADSVKASPQTLLSVEKSFIFLFFPLEDVACARKNRALGTHHVFFSDSGASLHHTLHSARALRMMTATRMLARETTTPGPPTDLYPVPHRRSTRSTDMAPDKTKAPGYGIFFLFFFSLFGKKQPPPFDRFSSSRNPPDDAQWQDISYGSISGAPTRPAKKENSAPCAGRPCDVPRTRR